MRIPCFYEKNILEDGKQETKKQFSFDSSFIFSTQSLCDVFCSTQFIPFLLRFYSCILEFFPNKKIQIKKKEQKKRTHTHTK